MSDPAEAPGRPQSQLAPPREPWPRVAASCGHSTTRGPGAAAVAAGVPDQRQVCCNEHEADAATGLPAEPGAPCTWALGQGGASEPGSGHCSQAPWAGWGEGGDLGRPARRGAAGRGLQPAPALLATGSSALVHAGETEGCSPAASLLGGPGRGLGCWVSGVQGAGVQCRTGPGVETSLLAACAEPRELPASIAWEYGGWLHRCTPSPGPELQGPGWGQGALHTHGVTSPHNPHKGVLSKLLVLSPFSKGDMGLGGRRCLLRVRGTARASPG